MQGTDDRKYRRRIQSWCMYDWANSAFATTIMAAMFPPFYRALVTEALGLAARLDSPAPLARVAAGHTFAVAAPVVDLAIRLRW